jgi:uncharacterized protein YlxW (UPF0749 family)
MARHRIGSRIPLTATALLLGMAIVAQFRAQGRVPVVASDGESQAFLLSELVGANSSLRAEIESLESQLTAYETERRGVGLQELVAELNRVKMLNGSVEVSGPGIEVQIDGPLSALDLQDLVNELRNAGGEAIALNGHRLVVTSVVAVESNGHLVADGHPVVRPFIFQAIGDPRSLESALRRPGGLLLLQQRSYSNLAVTITQHPRLVLAVHRPQDAHRDASALEYAQPID